MRLADESVCIGPPPARDSYLNIPAILSAAAITGADAIHPGYGFLSENAALRRDGGGARPDLHRPVAGAYPHDGRQDRRQDRDGRARRAAGAGLGRRGWPTCEAARRVAERDRLSGADQGRGRRRRARHEGGRDAGRAGGGLARRPHRGPRRVRQRRRLYGEVSRPAAPYRAAGAGRRARQRRAFRRARLQPAAAPPEAAGGGRLAGARPRRSATRWAPPPPPRCASSATATPARWSSCTRTASSPSSR